MDSRSWRSWPLSPFRIAFLYLLFGFIALFFSDVILPSVFEGSFLRLSQATKGAIEIFLTAGFIYSLVWIGWTNLALKERALDKAPVGMVITDTGERDYPIIFANEKFKELTGYDEAEILGRDCRFLQGERTDPETRSKMRTAIDNDRSCSVDIINYRKDGELFWNKVDIAPIRDESGSVTHFVGFQSDITDRKIREQRLTVLNRILRHNYRNQMTVIEGYLSILRQEIDGEHEALEKIQNGVDETTALVQKAQQTENILRKSNTSGETVEIGARVQTIIDEKRRHYPEVDITFSRSETGPCFSDSPEVYEAVDEAVTNAIEHNEGPHPEVTVRLERPREGWLEIEIEDNGPGIPEAEIEPLEEGETQLKHGGHMGLWMIQWVISQAGGSFSISESSDAGSVVSMTIPTVDESSA